MPIAFFKGYSVNVIAHFDSHGWKANANDALLLQKERCLWRWVVESKIFKDTAQGFRRFYRFLDEEIDVARVPRISVIGNGVPTYNDIFNPVPIQQLYKIAEVGR